MTIGSLAESKQSVEANIVSDSGPNCRVAEPGRTASSGRQLVD